MNPLEREKERLEAGDQEEAGPATSRWWGTELPFRGIWDLESTAFMTVCKGEGRVRSWVWGLAGLVRGRAITEMGTQ